MDERLQKLKAILLIGLLKRLGARETTDEPDSLLQLQRPEPVCDFCLSSDKPQHTFECQSFTVVASGTFLGIPISASNGNWCACPVCKQLVNDERWDELARRATERFIKMIPDAATQWDEIYEHMRQVHQEFRSMYRNTQ